jgi:hypothetical protein
MSKREKQVRDYVADQHKAEAGRQRNHGKGAESRYTEYKVRHGERHHSDPKR